MLQNPETSRSKFFKTLYFLGAWVFKTRKLQQNKCPKTTLLAKKTLWRQQDHLSCYTCGAPKQKSRLRTREHSKSYPQQPHCHSNLFPNKSFLVATLCFSISQKSIALAGSTRSHFCIPRIETEKFFCSRESWPNTDSIRQKGKSNMADHYSACRQQNLPIASRDAFTGFSRLMLGWGFRRVRWWKWPFASCIVHWGSAITSLINSIKFSGCRNYCRIKDPYCLFDDVA